MKIIKGDLIKLALNKEFDIIAHGCNCQSVQKAGIAKQMDIAFGTSTFPMEISWDGPKINKMGCIDVQKKIVNDQYPLLIANCYTQYKPGKPSPGSNIPLDYDALRLCMRKLNYIYEDMVLGLPMIGCGLAKGDWNRVYDVFEEELDNMKEVIIVKYQK